ncbi:MAG: aminotransferase class V-fold PLP-dependent enzyme [Acidobacteria bacterium]|nr:aminotransferase class V-fold PLP-dependent enzyme [Acidobacteriota bacterium]
MEIITEFLDSAKKEKVYRTKDPSELFKAFSDSLPEEGSKLEEIYDLLKRELLSTATLNTGPNFYAYLTGPGNHIAIPGEMLATTINPNATKWHLSRASTEIERQVIRWIAEFIGYDKNTGGLLLSGGSMANFTCLAVARKIKTPVDVAIDGLYGAPKMTAYISSEGHSSLEKSFDMLGLGKKHLRKIPVKPDLTVDINEMENRIRQDKTDGFHPFCVIGVAGTTNTGAVDDLAGLSALAKKYNLWYHIDAAYGGPAAKIEGYSHLFQGLELADSVVCDPHKWMYIPVEAGCALVKDPKYLRDTFSVLPDYLRLDADRENRFEYMEYGFELSRNFKALKVWMTFKYYGAERLKTEIKHDIDKIQYLKSLMEKSDDFEILAPTPLSILCFRYIGKDSKSKDEDYLNILNQRILDELEKDGRVFLSGTKINGKTALRTACINHRTELKDIDFLYNVLKEVGAAALPR